MMVEIDKDEVRRLLRQDALLFEVLAENAYERLHLAGARSLPLADLDQQAVEGLDRQQRVIVYCYDYQ